MKMVGLNKGALFSLWIFAAQGLKKNPVCPVCGTKTALIANPDAMVPIPAGLNAPVSQASCKMINDLGLRKIIPSDVCDLAQDSDEVKSLCGCYEPDEEKVVSTESPTVAPTTPTYPACFVCGTATSSVGNGDALVVLPQEFGSLATTTGCTELEAFGMAGFIPEEICVMAQSSTYLQETCGCIDETVTVPTSTTISPTVSPTTVEVSSNQTMSPTETLTDTPTNTPTNSPTKGPSMKPSIAPSTAPTLIDDSSLIDDTSSAFNIFNSSIMLLFVVGVMII